MHVVPGDSHVGFQGLVRLDQEYTHHLAGLSTLPVLVSISVDLCNRPAPSHLSRRQCNKGAA